MKNRILLAALLALVPCLAHAGALGYFGVKYLGDVVVVDFDSFASTGASSATTGLATSDIKVYKYCATTTSTIAERASTNGYTLVDTDGLDVDGRTGFNAITLDTSDNSDAGFWASGCDYLVHIDNVTIDSQTVRFTGRFSLDPNVLSYGSLSADSASVSTAKVGTTGITFANQYVSRIIWNITTNEKGCVTGSTDASPDIITFSPNAAAIWHTGDRYKVMLGDAPCYPVDLPDTVIVGGKKAVYFAAFAADGVTIDSDMASNWRVFNKNGGVPSLLTLNDIATQFAGLNSAIAAVPAALLATTIDGSLTLKCLLALDHATLVNSYSSSASSAPYSTTFKDPGGSTTRLVQSVTSLTRSPSSQNCPP